MKKIVLLMAIGCLSACTQATGSANQAYDSARGGVYHAAGKVQEWMQYNPEPTTPQAPQTRYCYKSLTDVLCYMRPQTNISNRLIGYQGAQPSNMPAHAVNFGPIVDANVQNGPFYVDHSPYMKDSGEMATSSRVHIVAGEITVKDTMNGQTSGGTTSSKAVVATRSPQRLMPSY